MADLLHSEPTKQSRGVEIAAVGVVQAVPTSATHARSAPQKVVKKVRGRHISTRNGDPAPFRCGTTLNVCWMGVLQPVGGSSTRRGRTPPTRILPPLRGGYPPYAKCMTVFFGWLPPLRKVYDGFGARSAPKIVMHTTKNARSVPNKYFGDNPNARSAPQKNPPLAAMCSCNYTYVGPALLVLPLFIISLVNLFVAGPPLKTVVLDSSGPSYGASLPFLQLNVDGPQAKFNLYPTDEMTHFFVVTCYAPDATGPLFFDAQVTGKKHAGATSKALTTASTRPASGCISSTTSLRVGSTTKRCASPSTSSAGCGPCAGIWSRSRIRTARCGCSRCHRFRLGCLPVPECPRTHSDTRRYTLAHSAAQCRCTSSLAGSDDDDDDQLGDDHAG